MARVNIEAELEILAERKRFAENIIRKAREEREAKVRAVVELARTRALEFISQQKEAVLKTNPHEFLERNGWRFMGTTFNPGAKFPTTQWYANMEVFNTTQTFRVVDAVEVTLAAWLAHRAGVDVKQFNKHLDLGIVIPE